MRLCATQAFLLSVFSSLCPRSQAGAFFWVAAVYFLTMVMRIFIENLSICFPPLLYLCAVKRGKRKFMRVKVWWVRIFIENLTVAICGCETLFLVTRPSLSDIGGAGWVGSAKLA